MFLKRRLKSHSFATRRPKTKGYTLLLIPNENGSTRRLSVPKFTLQALTVALFLTFTTIGAVTYDYLHLRHSMSDYETLKVENRNIRSEAAALAEKLDKVQRTLNKVDTFSDQVRAVVESEPTTKKKSGTADLLKTSIAGGPIGPLSKEEDELRRSVKNVSSGNAAGLVNSDSLEFKGLFNQLSEIEQKGGEQAKDLEILLGDLQAYRKQLDSTPTIWPVKGWVSSIFGVRQSPFLKENRMHWGLDIAAPLGSPIHSAANGTVIRVGHAEDYGNFVEVSHGYGLVSRYAHAYAIYVKVGDKVKKGSVLGAVGMTGRTTGPHLHYEIELNGKRIDPSKFIQSF